MKKKMHKNGGSFWATTYFFAIFFKKIKNFYKNAIFRHFSRLEYGII